MPAGTTRSQVPVSVPAPVPVTGFHTIRYRQESTVDLSLRRRHQVDKAGRTAWSSRSPSQPRVPDSSAASWRSTASQKPAVASSTGLSWGAVSRRSQNRWRWKG
jgi:hypothetical protein